LFFSTISPSVPAKTFQCPADDDGKAKLSLEIDRAMRENAPAGWRGDDTPKSRCLTPVPLMARDRQATQSIFDIIKNQPITYERDDSNRRCFHSCQPKGREECASLGAPAERTGDTCGSRSDTSEVARAYAISKLGWIRDQQSKLHNQAREAPRKFEERESHYFGVGGIFSNNRLSSYETFHHARPSTTR